MIIKFERKGVVWLLQILQRTQCCDGLVGCLNHIVIFVNNLLHQSPQLLLQLHTPGCHSPPISLCHFGYYETRSKKQKTRKGKNCSGIRRLGIGGNGEKDSELLWWAAAFSFSFLIWILLCLLLFPFVFQRERENEWMKWWNGETFMRWKIRFTTLYMMYTRTRPHGLDEMRYIMLCYD